MFDKPSIKDSLIVLTLIMCTTFFGYIYANSEIRTKVWLSTYPLRAMLSKQQLSCNDNAPIWLAKTLQYQVDYGNAPSNQIAYIDPQGHLYHCENGYMGKYPVLSAPVSSDTRFRFASVTKLWTSDATLDLVKSGKLSLDTRLSEVLTEIRDPKDERISDITIADLLLHRAGFNRYSIFGNDMFGIGEEICPNHLNRLNTIQLDFNPNEVMSYSNLGYCLLGEVIKKVDNPGVNSSYEDVIKTKYNFDNTSFKFIDDHAMDDEVFYNYVEMGLFGIGDIYTAFDYKKVASAAGLSGTAIDVAKQVAFMADKPEPNILSLDESLSCDISKLHDCYGYAMFPYKKSEQDLTVYFRDGGLLGWSSLVIVDQKGGTTVILSNGNDVSHQDDLKEKMYLNLLHHYNE